MSIKYIIFCFATLFLCCDKDDPKIPNEQEVITTFEYILTTKSGSSDSKVSIRFTDLDGPGGDAPQVNDITLESNTIYNGTFSIKNEKENPAVDVLDEIKEEAEEHQFFFEYPDDLDLEVKYDDKDKNNKPIGIKTILTTKTASNGKKKMKITLKHKPDKNAKDVDKGDITNAGGETDIEVSFDVTIK